MDQAIAPHPSPGGEIAMVLRWEDWLLRQSATCATQWDTQPPGGPWGPLGLLRPPGPNGLYLHPVDLGSLWAGDRHGFCFRYSASNIEPGLPVVPHKAAAEVSE